MLLLASSVNTQAVERSQGQQWSVALASIWYDQLPWPVGFNYAPRYAINQPETCAFRIILKNHLT